MKMAQFYCTYCQATFARLGDYEKHVLNCPNVPGNAPRPEAVRGSTHGDYTRMATTAQNIKIAMRAGPEGHAAWVRLRPVQTESLELIATKLARIMVGDACCEDHWRDIAGYATLVADRIKSGELKNA